MHRRSLSQWARRSTLPPVPSLGEYRLEFITHASRVLEQAHSLLPHTSAYHSAITSLYTHRLEVVKNSQLTAAQIEEKLGAGPIFELIDAAKDEADIVIPLLAKEKPWELEDHDPAYQLEDPDFVPWQRKVLVE